MKRFNKFILITAILFCLLNIFSFVAFAQDDFDDLEVTYPNLTVYVNAPETSRTYLPNYIKYVYTFAVYAGGFIAFVCLLIGGFRLLTSVGNPGVMQDARDQIFSGIIGMLIIFGSYLILKELNPDLTSFSIPEVTTLKKGIVLYSDSNCGGGKANGEPYKVDLAAENIQYKRLGDTKTNLSEDKGDFWTINSFWSYHTRQDLDVSFYQTKDCSGEAMPNEVNKPDYKLAVGCCALGGCSGGGNALGLRNVQCIKLVWRNPGIWLFSKENGNPLNPKGQEGTDYVNYQTSQDAIKDKIAGNVHSVALVKSSTDYYGAIIHNLPAGTKGGGDRGWAEVLLPVMGYDITVYNLGTAVNMESGVESITIFRIPGEDPNTSDEFTLFREVGKKLSNTDKGNTGDKGVVTPQFNIKWEGPTNEKLIDVTQELCNEAKVANISRAMNEENSYNWPESPVKCGEAEKYKYVVGGIKVLGLTWIDEENKEVKKNGQLLKVDKKDGGVSGIYMPTEGKYIALLYEKGAKPEVLARDGFGAWSNAAIIFGSYSDLSTTGFENRLGTLVVIREK